MSERFALRLAAADASALGPLRLSPGLEVCAVDATLWLRGPASEALQPRLDLLPATDRYTLEDDLLCPVGASLPSARLPAGPWRPLAELLPFEPRPRRAPSREQERVQLTLGPAAEERQASLLLTSLSAFARWASGAPAVRFGGLTFAADEAPGGAARVLIRGRVLPPLPGLRLWEEAGLVVPCGRTWRPPLPAPIVAEALELLPGELALLGEDGYERIPDTAFVPARRAAVRATCSETGS